LEHRGKTIYLLIANQDTGRTRDHRSASRTNAVGKIFLHAPTITTEQTMKKQTIVTRTVQADGSIVTKTVTQEVPSDDSFAKSRVRRSHQAPDPKRASRGKKSIHKHVLH
jgi:hypothetical protein